jgi:ABC-type transport system substrate-binding protein
VRSVRLLSHLGLLAAASACVAAPRPSDVVVFASGTDLESGNPLVTMHPLSRQVQRYALFTTLARYDTTLSPVPYLARSWEWSDDRRTLTLNLVPTLRWHDGNLTTANDVAFTILTARDPVTGYPRAGDLAAIDTAVAVDVYTAGVPAGILRVTCRAGPSPARRATPRYAPTRFRACSSRERPIQVR